MSSNTTFWDSPRESQRFMEEDIETGAFARNADFVWQTWRARKGRNHDERYGIL